MNGQQMTITSTKTKFFFFNSPTDAHVNCLKNNFEIYSKINTNFL